VPVSRRHHLADALNGGSDRRNRDGGGLGTHGASERRKLPALRLPRLPARTDSRSSRIRTASRPSTSRKEPSMSPDRLIYMANQIGKFFQSQGYENAVPGIADHIRRFWDPRMRAAIFAHFDAGGAGLDPNVRDAIAKLKTASTKLPG
jgi:formate dehydrogenase subunit delta